MFSITRRASTLALLAATAIGSGLSADPASAAGASGPVTFAAAQPGEPVALLLPAVQAAREAAARMRCS